MSCKITKKDGTDIVSVQPQDRTDAGQQAAGQLPAASRQPKVSTAPIVIDPVGPVNNFLSSLFSRVDVSIQDHNITPADHLYSYTAYFKNLLFTTLEEKQGILQTEMFYADDSRYMDHHIPIPNYTAGNSGLQERSKFFASSNVVDLCGRLYTDMNEIDRYIANGVSVRIKLYLNRPEFCLMALPENEYQFKISKAYLNVCTVNTAPEIVVAHSEILKTHPAIYPYTKTETKRFTLTSGVHSTEINDPFQGRIPSEFFVALVRENAVHGQYDKNPFNFINADVTSIQCTVDSQDLGQGQIQMRYGDTPEDSNYMEAYNTFRGLLENPSNIPITRAQFFNGYTVYRFYSEMPKENNNISNEYLPLRRNGNLKISIKFAKALPETTTILIMARFSSAFKIVYEI